MEKSITWYLLSLKLYMKKKMYYFQLLAMLLVLFLIYKIQMPELNTVAVGVCYEDSTLGKEIYETLDESDSAFEYSVYVNVDELRRDVLGGKLEGGFVFTELFDEGVKTGETKDTILFYSTPFSMKAEVLKETVYAAVFESISETLLLEIDKEQYGEADAYRSQRVAELNKWYLESDALFKLEIVEVPTESKESEQEIQQKSLFQAKTYPIQGTAGLLTFLIMYLAYSQRWEVGSRAVLKALSRKDQVMYMAISVLAAATIPAILSMGIAVFAQETRGMLIEMITMIILILVSIIWITLLGKIIKNYMTYIGCGLAVLLANAVLCPIFIDLSVFVPAIKYVRMMLPLGWYFLF